MSNWQEFRFRDRINEILADVRYFNPDHHFGRPFLTAYQIAIEFARRYQDDYARFDLPVGGEGTGQHNSLTQYVAQQLSARINSGEITDIEGGFLSNRHLRDITFDNDGSIVRSSLTDTQYDLSMFRLQNT